MQSPGGSRKLQATADPALVKAQTVAEAVRQMQNVGVSSSATTVPWTGVTGTPTTLAGYGITNAAIGVGGVAVNATTAVTAGTVTTAAQPAITSVGTLTGLTVKGTVAISGSSSGAVSFVAQAAAGSTTYVLPNADGINNDVLTTDGSGNLTWSVKGGGTISTINGDGSAAQTLAAGAGLTIVDAGPVHTFALDLNYAPTYTTTITAAGFAGPLTGNADTATNVAWSGVTSTPTTLAGYGITDAYTKTAADARYAPIAGPFPWSDVSSTPTSLGGYGITDAYTKSASDARFAAISGPFPWSDVSGTPTTLAGYGITDAYTKTAGDARYSPIAGSSSIVTIGTLGAGAVPASLVTAGTFGANVGGGSYAFSNNNGAPDILTIGNNVSGDAGGIRFLTGAAHYSWLFAAQFNVGGALEWTPSTAVGGTTFSTPVMTLTQAGVLTVTSTIGAANFSGSSSGTNTGDQTSVSGNAGTATKLATARAINGVNFDGSAAITVTAAAGTLTGATLAAGVTASSLTSVGTLTSVTTSGMLNQTASPTLVLGSTSGDVFFSMTDIGAAYKQCIIYLNVLVGTASFTFPTAFTKSPVILSNGLNGTVTTLTTTAVTVTGASNTGAILLSGI